MEKIGTNVMLQWAKYKQSLFLFLIFLEHWTHEIKYLIANWVIHFFQNLLASHDIVAQRDYQPKLSEIPVEVDEDEETIKIVQLVKSQDALVSDK